MDSAFSAIGRRAAAVAMVAVGAMVAGCGSGGPGVASLHGGAHPTPSSSTGDLAKFQAVVVCARLHGLPDLPDATVDDHGQAQFPAVPGGGKPPQSVLDGCKDQIAALPAKTGSSRSSRAPLSAADLAKVKQFSACVRTQGYPNFPDPQPDGSFAFASSDASQAPPKDGPAFTACRHFLPTR